MRADQVADSVWRLTVRELPDTWTVAFGLQEVEARARFRIHLDTGLDPDAFDIAFDPPGGFRWVLVD